MLIPMFFLIGVWGHERRIYAAVKFFIFTLAGSLLMLLAMIALYLIHGPRPASTALPSPIWPETHLAPEQGWLLFARLSARLRHQDAAGALPHLAPRRPYRGAGRPAPSTWLVCCSRPGSTACCASPSRSFPAQTAASLPLLAGLALAGIFYAAWVAYRAEGRQAAGCLLLHRPSRLRRSSVLPPGTPSPCEGAFCRWSTTASPPAPSSA